jgi:hypothetical protein
LQQVLQAFLSIQNLPHQSTGSKDW